MNRKRLIAAALAGLLLSGCAAQASAPTAEETVTTEARPAEPAPAYTLRDLDALYRNDNPESVTTMYLTVSDGAWAALNAQEAADGDLAGLLQIGDENGPLIGEIGYQETSANAAVRVSGDNAQKDYRITVDPGKGQWRGQSEIVLNKYQHDALRFGSKLVFDLLKDIPQLMSLRTQFVRLYVKDTAAGGTEFLDYGLYTQVEQMDKSDLWNHGLDAGGHLYELKSFDFDRYEDVIKAESDPGFDRDRFEALLKIRGNPDHRKLQEMLDAVNDHSQPFDEVLDRYFDRENLAYWMGFMILLGNVDAQSGHTFLYSPRESEKWFLMPGDNEALALPNDLSAAPAGVHWEAGVSNYWGNVLFRRCLQSRQFRQELDRAVTDLRELLSRERLQSMADRYSAVVMPYLNREPDKENAVPAADYEKKAAGLFDVIESNYRLYRESLNKPMPFYIGQPEIRDGVLRLEWDASYDFEAQDVTFTAEVARDVGLKDILCRVENLRIPELELELLPPGQYFVHISAQNESGGVQDAFDLCEGPDGPVYGTRGFLIQEDGSVLSN